MRIRDDVNEYGTPVTWIKCDSCGSEVSICPAVGEESPTMLKYCMTPGCKSYRPECDVDILFMSDKELANHADKVGVTSFEMLQKRRKFQGGDKSVLTKESD